MLFSNLCVTRRKMKIEQTFHLGGDIYLLMVAEKMRFDVFIIGCFAGSGTPVSQKSRFVSIVRSRTTITVQSGSLRPAVMFFYAFIIGRMKVRADQLNRTIRWATHIGAERVSAQHQKTWKRAVRLLNEIRLLRPRVLNNNERRSAKLGVNWVCLLLKNRTAGRAL